MKKAAISPDALNRFRAAATNYTHTAKPRASRLLALKDDIAALRKRGISYRAISELLTQNGISASDTCVTNFCHRVLEDKPARKFAATRRASHRANHPALLDNMQMASENTSQPPAEHLTQKPTIPPTDAAPPTSRGPRIAKVEQLPPGETI